MKLIALLATTALSLNAQEPAQDLNAQIGCLIGPDAKMMYGVDVERYRSSQLAQLYPVPFGMNFPNLSIKKLFGTLTDTSEGHSPAVILQGVSFSAQALIQEPRYERFLRTFRGFPAVALSENSLLVILTTTLAVTGETDSVSRVIDQWGLPNDQCTGELTAKLTGLSNSYDAWFAVLRPLEQMALPAAMPPSEHRLELAQSIEEVEGGIRIGPTHSVRIELTARNPDDAAALAVLARWLPAMLETEQSVEANLARAIEKFETQATGRTASLSFLLTEQAVESAQRVNGNRKVDFGNGQ